MVNGASPYKPNVKVEPYFMVAFMLQPLNFGVGADCGSRCRLEMRKNNDPSAGTTAGTPAEKFNETLLTLLDVSRTLNPERRIAIRAKLFLINAPKSLL